MSYINHTTGDLVSQYLDAHNDTSTAVLHDTKPGTNEDRPWRLHRAQAELLSTAYEDINLNKAARVAACAGWLAYTPPTNDQPMPLAKRQFCRVRVCPMCQWRRSLKIDGQTSQIINAANASRQGGYAWVMLTLTQRNVDGPALGPELDRIGKAWQRLTQRKEYKQAVKGSMRCIEITRNPRTGLYHPHIHALLCVLPSYFRSRSYISRDRWALLWAQCARLDYRPSVWVTKSYGDHAKQMAEVSKYATKPADYIVPDDWDYTIDSILTLDAATAKRRFLAYGGLLKTIKTQLKLDDADSDNADLIHIDDTAAPEVSDDLAGKLIYDWSPGFKNYYRRG